LEIERCMNREIYIVVIVLSKWRSLCCGQCTVFGDNLTSENGENHEMEKNYKKLIHLKNFVGKRSKNHQNNRYVNEVLKR
jgi:hypothetical protein